MAALAAQRGSPTALDHVCARKVPERRFDGCPKRRLDAEVLVHAASAKLARRACDPPILVLGETLRDLLEPAACPGEQRSGSSRLLGNGTTRALGGVGR